MIVVYTDDGERIECPTANRFKTDEHNNLDVMSGPENRPAPVACFSQGHWIRVVIKDAEQDPD